MDELPHRSVIDLKATLGEFDHEPSQGEVSVLDPLQQPDAVRARDRPWLVTAHLARCDAAGLAQPPDPVDCRADSYPELLRSLIARQITGLHRRNHALAKIIGIRLAHPSWPLSRPAC